MSRQFRFVLLVILINCLLIGDHLIAADTYRPRVPSSMEFAGMKLKITEAARKDIQEDVDRLTKSEKYFEIKADRARLYFPIIEETLKSQNVPDDFKYLSLQESALISDAVSSANAVGFWQFKDFTGREVGLRIDRNVDERLNIVSSTIGAAKYFKRHNFYFNNWIYTLLAHMTGRGGAAKYVDKSHFGSDKMTIDRKSHWYVKRCIAHKIAFEKIMEKKHSQGLKLAQYTKGGGKSLSKIAQELKVDETDLKQYNKWLKSGKVPTEKAYVVIVMVRGKIRFDSSKEEKLKQEKEVVSDPKNGSDKSTPVTEKLFPSLSQKLNTSNTIFIKINGLPTVLVKKGESINSISKSVGLSPERFAKNNDISPTSQLITGQVYYLKPKRKRALTYYYTSQPNENLWQVSQKFGIKIKHLAKLNRMTIIDDLKPGRVLWMKKRRPKGSPVEFKALPRMPVDETVSKKELIKKKHEKKEPEQDSIQEYPVENLSKSEKTDKKIVKKDFVNDTNELASYFEHEVEKGETLYALAKKYGISVSDLIEWNDLEDRVQLSIGQILVIHGEGKPFQMEPSEVSFHVVEPGDTMYKIAQQYDVKIEKLMEINQKENFALSVGERIKVRE